MRAPAALATPAEGAAGAGARPRIAGRPLLLLAAVVPLFCALGSWPLFDPDEGRNAAVGREVLAGDHVVPHLDGLPYLDKPILLFWAVAASVRTFGPRDAAARLPSAVAAAATVGLTAALGTLLVDPEVGLLAGIAVASMPLLLVFGRLVIFDAPLTAFATAALYALARARLRGGALRWWPIAGLAMGLGVLTKGPVGVAVPLLAWIAARGVLPAPPRGERRVLAALGAVAVVVAVVAPWLAAVQAREPDFLRYALVDETVLRFVSPERFHRDAPIWFYATVLPWALGPWAVVLGVTARALAAAARRRDRYGTAAAFAARAATALVVFFTLSASKRPQYVLPVLAPLAVLVAVGVAVARERAAHAVAATARWAVVAGVVGLGLAAVRYRPVATDFAALSPAVLGTGGLALLAWGAATVVAARRSATAAIVAAAVLAPALLMALTGPLRPYAERRGARALAAHVPADARLVGFATFTPGLVWYLGRPVVVVTDTGRELTSNYVRAGHGAGRRAEVLVPISRLHDVLDGPGPVCVVVRWDRLHEFRRRAHRRLVPLWADGRGVLLAVGA